MYAVRNRATKVIIEGGLETKEEAEELIQTFEEQDKVDDVYEPNFYEIHEEDENNA